MNVWAVINQKGGQGKTTVSTGFAVEACAEGAAVVILDTDDRQASASFWENARAADDITVVSTGIAVLPMNLTKAQKGGAEFVIIDTPANSRDIATAAAGAASFVIVPCKPAPLDIASCLQTITQLKQVGTPFAVVLSQVKHTGSEADEAAAVFTDAGAHVLTTRLHDRKDYSNSSAFGQSPVEYDARGKAAAEIRAAFEEVSGLAGYPVSTKREAA